MRGTHERLFPGMTEPGGAQATLGIRSGGLGTRTARDVALPAALASQVVAQPKVDDFDDWMARAGLLPGGLVSARFRKQVRDTTADLQSRLNPTGAAQLDSMVDSAHRAASAQWAASKRGDVRQADGEQLPRARWMAIAEDDVAIPPPDEQSTQAEPSDGEEGATAEGRRVTPGNLQKQLSVLVDHTNLHDQVDHLRKTGGHQHLRRLREIRDPSVNHDWIHHLDRTQGKVLDLSLIHI